MVAKSAKKNPLTRKSSGPSALKLEDTVSITVKNCEVLLEQVDYLLKHAASKGNKRIEEVVSIAKKNLTDVVQRKLKYASGLLSSQSQNEHCSTASNVSSPGSSPESSLTSNTNRSDPTSCGQQRLQINDGELKRAAEKLKPPSVAIQRGEDYRKCHGYRTAL